MSSGSFRREDIVRLLVDLEVRLNARGVALNIQIVGGAALLLHGLIERATGDIDARYASAAAVEQVAREMAVEYSLPPDWINSRAMAFLPENATWMAGPEGTSAAIQLADLPTLAAMKVAAERPKDIADLGHIINAMGIQEPDRLVDFAYEKFGEESMTLTQGRNNYEIVAEEALKAAEAFRKKK